MKKLSLPKLSSKSLSLKSPFKKKSKFKAAKVKAPKKPRTREEMIKDALFLLVLVFFIGAAAFTMLNFTKMNKILADDGSDFEMPELAPSKALESAKVLNEKYDAYKKLRHDSPELASLSSALGRSPIAEVVPPPSVAADTMLPEYVPTVEIKGLVVLGKRTICSLNIEGEEPGQIYNAGQTFGEGKGKIVSIDSKGVDWTWEKKKHRTTL